MDFDFSKVLTSVVAIVAPLAVLAIRRPISRVEDTTKRLQYWKTYIELKNLAGSDVTADEKLRCAMQLGEADDEARNLRNKLLSFIAGIATIAIVFALMTLIVRAFAATMDIARQQFPSSDVQYRDFSEQYGFLSLILQIIAASACWIWVRWWIRDYVWNRSTLGSAFSFIRTSGKVRSAVVQIVLGILLIVWVFACLSIKMPAPLQH